MRLLFWISLATILYVYIGYPLALLVWSRLRPKAVRRAADPAALPAISIILIARNEVERIGARIDNLLACDYPAGRRQIVVVSDGSTDGTATALAPYADRIDRIELPPVGKAAALNHAVALAHHDVLVFADARQAFDRDALVALVAPFVDPGVGAVTGQLLLDSETGERRCRHRRGQSRWAQGERRVTTRSAAADGMGLYWKYEKALRRMESSIGSTLGATGAIYAMRRALWRPLPADTLLDDVLAPMRVVLGGHRVVFEEGARAFDRASTSADIEARRKVRTLAGNVQILWLEPRLLLPGLNPVWWQYLSHKVGRLVVPYALLTLFAASLPLARQHPFYLLALLGQSTFYLLAGYGALLEYMREASATAPAALPRPTATPYVDRRRRPRDVVEGWRQSTRPFDEGRA